MEKIQERLEKTARTLESSNIPYAIIGGNAVRAWVAQVDEAAVRTTRDVDILINRADLLAAKTAMESAGFVYRHVKSIDMFLDGPDAKARDAVHLLFAGEKVRDTDLLASPEVSESVPINEHTILALESLVRMKLTSYRRKDQVHLLDMISVKLIDKTWPIRFPPELATRLQTLLDDPDG